MTSATTSKTYNKTMIPGIENTPPSVALALGFFMALALKRGRIAKILDKFLPGGDDE